MSERKRKVEKQENEISKGRKTEYGHERKRDVRVKENGI